MSKAADRKATKRYLRKIRVDQQNRSRLDKLFASGPKPLNLNISWWLGKA
jgi:hypothetical protein